MRRWNIGLWLLIGWLGLAWGVPYEDFMQDEPEKPKPPKVEKAKEEKPVEKPKAVEKPKPERPKRYRLWVKVRPGDADVEFVGTRTRYRDGVELAPGNYKIRVERSGYETEERWLEIEGADKEVEVTLKAEKKKEPEPVAVNTTHPELVSIRGGCFQMGSPESEPGRDSDEHLHQVCLKDFKLGKYEVTVGQFKRFVEASGYRTEAEHGDGCYIWTGKWEKQAGKSWRDPGFKQGEDHPVVCVSWNDAIAYTEWLSKQTTGQRYRLPTEAEWEYAARAGTQTARYWGDAVDARACEFANITDSAHWSGETFPCDDKFHDSSPVGRFKPNPWGLHDMLGNALEWTCSAYSADAGKETTSFLGWTTKDESETQCVSKNYAALRVNRGGSWLYGFPAWVRSACRTRRSPDIRDYHLGFRLAQD